MTISYTVTEREQALERENERYLKTINIQSVTIEAQQEELAKLRAELAALKAQPVQEPIGWLYEAATLGGYFAEFSKSRKTGPYRDPECWQECQVYAATVQEPVASLTINKFRGHLTNHDIDYFGNLPEGSYSLYTAPVQPAPLTDEQIELALKAACMHSTAESRKDMRRAIEAAIKGETK